MAELTNIGAIMISDALPEDMRKEQYHLDKGGIHKMFMELADKHPEKYKDVLQKLSDIGKTAAWTEGASVSLSALKRSQAKGDILAKVQPQINALLNDDSLTDDQRDKAIVDTLLPHVGPMQKAVYDESKAENSPYVFQLESGTRGKKSDLNSMRGADLLTTDQNDRFLPIPLTRGYAEGYTPAQYFAASYGQRKGAVGVKLATADAGFTTKKLSNAAHRIVVTHDTPAERRLPIGLPTETSDTDNVGSVLARDAGPLKAGTILTAQHLADLKDEGVDDILVHSTMTEPSEDGGISRLAAGRRTRGGLSMVGDNIGLQSAQAIGEKLSQGSLSSKHSAGVSDRINKSGMEYITRLLDAPENFPEAGPLSEEDGVITKITKAPQGGQYIHVGKKPYFVPEGIEPVVKVGQHIEHGDELTDGTPHPRDLVRLRGMGEARRVYAKHLKEALDNSGANTHRRNIEPVVAGLMNWAQVKAVNGIGDNVYGDIVPFNKLVHDYQPRPAAKNSNPEAAVGKYLEEPALHYTPGTRITKKVAGDLKKWGIKDVYSHEDPPEFEPVPVRSMLGVFYDPDWRTQQLGFYTSKAFENALHRGATSDTDSTSYAPALAKPATLGQNLTSTGHYG